MDYYIKKYSMSTILVSVLLIIWSIYLITNPINSINFIISILGVIITIDGIAHLVSYFLSPKESRKVNLEIFHVIIALVCGIIIFVRPDIISGVLPIAVGVLLILESVIKIKLSINMKILGIPYWNISIILSILTIILGTLIIFNPATTISLTMVFLGVILLSSEIINIVNAIIVMFCLRNKTLKEV